MCCIIMNFSNFALPSRSFFGHTRIYQIICPPTFTRALYFQYSLLYFHYNCFNTILFLSFAFFYQCQVRKNNDVFPKLAFTLITFLQKFLLTRKLDFRISSLHLCLFGKYSKQILCCKSTQTQSTMNITRDANSQAIFIPLGFGESRTAFFHSSGNF